MRAEVENFKIKDFGRFILNHRIKNKMSQKQVADHRRLKDEFGKEPYLNEALKQYLSKENLEYGI